MSAAPRQRARAPADRSEARSKLMHAIRAACRRKGLDDDDRRALQGEIIGKASLADMTPAELGRFLDHLNRDWKGPAGDRAHLGKIRALWWSLYWLGAIERPDDEALTVFVRRQTGIDHLRFLDHRKAPAVIEALKSWLEREGVSWRSDDEIRNLGSGPMAAPGWSRLEADRLAVLDAIVDGLRRTNYFQTNAGYDLVLAWLGKTSHNTLALTARDLDAAIREFGKRLRRRREGVPA